MLRVRHPSRDLPRARPFAGAFVVLGTLFLTSIALASGCWESDEPASRQGPPSSARAVPVLAAPDALALPSALKASFAAMANAPAFGGLAIGAAGSPAAATEGFRALLGAPQAAGAFALAAERGSPAGQLYGLSGLALVDPPAFQQRLAAFRTREDVVGVWMSGCTGGEPTRMREVVETAGAARLDAPGDTVTAWQARNPGKPFQADIAGGFLPVMLAGDAWPLPATPGSASTGAPASASPSASSSRPRPRG